MGLLLTRDSRRLLDSSTSVIPSDSYPLEASRTIKPSSILPSSRPLYEGQHSNPARPTCALWPAPRPAPRVNWACPEVRRRARQLRPEEDCSARHHGACRGGVRGRLCPLALPAAFHAALPPGDPPHARLSVPITPPPPPAPGLGPAPELVQLP